MDSQLNILDATLVEGAAPIFSLVEARIASNEPSNAESTQQEPEVASSQSHETGASNNESIDFRKAVEQAFTDLERRAFEMEWSAAMTRDVKFALAAYVDEAVMSSNLESKLEWMSRPLCIEYFGESKAGEAFFDKLDLLRENLLENQVTISLYYVCLQLGYQGMYRIRGYERLQAYLSTFRNQLDDTFSAAPRTLAEAAIPENKLIYRIGTRQPYWVMLSVGGAVLVSMVLTYGAVMKYSLNESAHRIEQAEYILTR
ncbi:DotU family type IV/VI secretion system protein [Marinomonas balearica]|uniref:Type VI secretion system protein ImpK n=1 Tax=Marinomonas balearica TaxID=491947 RepID=A0A4R6M2Q2_9GAMM|nr:DotU family type IV/VI secretion system protein [Marinomonas balearica]TDO95538.1 type VI secretion system protein ImpK [Marinomonas balearica]